MRHDIDQHNSADYYLRRVAQARSLANEAINPAIRKIHMDFAERYALLASIRPDWRKS